MVESKVLINIDKDVKKETAKGIRKEAQKRKWSLRKTVINILNRNFKSRLPKINFKRGGEK